MSFEEAWKVVMYILRTMEHGEIRLFVKNGKVTHVNRTDEVFPKDLIDGIMLSEKDVRP